MKAQFKPTLEAPLKLARSFINKFGFGHIPIEKFDMWIIDRHIIEDPETDEKSDPRYREFTTGRTRAKAMLNRRGPECDDGDRFHIRVLIPGKLYEIVPYTIAMLDNSADFAAQLSRYLTGKTDKLVKQERKVFDLSLFNGKDQPELIEASKVLKAARDGKERVAREIRERVHQMNAWDIETEKFITRLSLKYDKKT